MITRRSCQGAGRTLFTKGDVYKYSASEFMFKMCLGSRGPRSPSLAVGGWGDLDWTGRNNKHFFSRVALQTRENLHPAPQTCGCNLHPVTAACRDSESSNLLCRNATISTEVLAAISVVAATRD